MKNDPIYDFCVAFAYAAAAAMSIIFLWAFLMATAAWATADGDGTPPGMSWFLVDPGQGAPNTTTVPKSDFVLPGDARLWLVGGDVPEDLYPNNGGGVPFDVPPGALVLPGVPKPGPYGDGYGPTTPPPSVPEYIPPPTYYPPNDRYGYDTPPPAEAPGPFTYGRRGFEFGR